MGGHGPACRLVVGVSIVALLGGCAAASSPAPSNAPLTGAPSMPVATPAASAATEAPTIELTGFSVRPFGVGYATNTFFTIDADGNVYLPGGSKGAALVKLAPDGRVLARWTGSTSCGVNPTRLWASRSTEPPATSGSPTPALTPSCAWRPTSPRRTGGERPAPTRASSSARAGSPSTRRGTSSSRTWETTGSRPSCPTGRSCRTGPPRAERPRRTTWPSARTTASTPRPCSRSACSWVVARSCASWEKLGADTATASSNARRAIATWSTHMIPYTQPGLVIEAVKQVVAAARATDHTLPACGAALAQLGGSCP